MLEHAYIPRPLADDRSNLVDVEAPQYPEQNHLGLPPRQTRPNERYGGVGVEHIEGKSGRVIRGWTLTKDLRRYRNAPSARLTASPVDETVPRNREHPGAELAVITVEGPEISSGCEPRVGLDVFCRRRIESPQEPQQPRMQLVPQDGDGPGRSALRGREHLGELVRGHVSR